jgi:hypothetical protein
MSGESSDQSNYEMLVDMNNTINSKGGAYALATAANIGGYMTVMKTVIPQDSYAYIKVLTDKIIIAKKGTIELNEKGNLLKNEIQEYLIASKSLLQSDSKNDKNFEATYKNVQNFFRYLNEGVYRNIWDIGNSPNGGKKKTRRRNKSKRKRKSRRARR